MAVLRSSEKGHPVIQSARQGYILNPKKFGLLCTLVGFMLLEHAGHVQADEKKHEAYVKQTTKIVALETLVLTPQEPPLIVLASPLFTPTPDPTPKPIERPVETPKPKIVQTPKVVAKEPAKASFVSSTHAFAPGQCTQYAASRFPVTWSGNASAWARNARAQGYTVDKTVKAGTLIVTSENSKSCPGCGHVVVVDSVEGSQAHISEMNYVGIGIVSRRTISINSPIIVGVIHRKGV